MTKSELLRASDALSLGVGYTYARLHTLIIHEGFCRARETGSFLGDMKDWADAERTFHSAQMLRWAADALAPAERAYWIATATKREPVALRLAA